MSELNIVRLHAGLQHEYGLDAVYLSEKSSTTSTYLLTPNGLPISVGWFDNSRKSLPHPNVYALAAYPDAPRNMHHRLILEQLRDVGAATLTEEDSADYLEGYDDYPLLLQRKRLSQCEVDETIRHHCVGAYVLNALTGKRYVDFVQLHSYDVPAVREYGLALIEAGDTLDMIDDSSLDRYAQTDPPALH